MPTPEQWQHGDKGEQENGADCLDTASIFSPVWAGLQYDGVQLVYLAITYNIGNLHLCFSHRKYFDDIFEIFQPLWVDC